MVSIALRGRVVDWFNLLISARRLATAREPWVSASEASEYGLDLLAAAEFDGLTDQQRKILLMHGEMWLVRPRWERSELITLLGKQLDTYRLFGLPEQIDSELAGAIDELHALAS
jgi:hypothetical protein